MSFQCFDCSRKFMESRGLSVHLRYCSEAHRKRKEESEGPSSASKRARYSNSESETSPNPDLGFNEGIAMTDVVPEIEVLPESPPASVSFSGRRRKVPRALKDYILHPSFSGRIAFTLAPCASQAYTAHRTRSFEPVTPTGSRARANG